MNYFSAMLDCSRNAVYTVSTVKKFIDALQKMGYNSLMLYTEDTYEIKSQPRFGYLRGRYSVEELREIVAYGKEKGITLIPCIQTLAHLNQIFRWSEFNDIHDTDDILLIDEEKTYTLIEDMFKAVREVFDTDVIHIGMDEAHNVGLGKYIARHGFCDRFQLLSRHLNRVAKIAADYGFKPLMWSDMFFRLATGGEYSVSDPEIITKEIADLVPENVELVYWDYYSEDINRYTNMLKAHKRFNSPTWFAGGAWKWTGFTPHNSLSVKHTEPALRACVEQEVKNVFITLWGDNGDEASLFSVLPSLFHAAECYRGNYDLEDIKAKFEAAFGIGFDTMCLLDCPAELFDPNHNRDDDIEKIMLYNDPLLGIYDSFAKESPNAAEYYSDCAKRLSAHINSPYGYIFDTLASLCSLLEVKFSLGVELRTAYKANDKNALKALADRIETALERLELFHEKLRFQWMSEAKPHGFDVQDIRLGALRARLLSAKHAVLNYLNGTVDKIEELEEEILDCDCRKYYDNYWTRLVTPNAL